MYSEVLIIIRTFHWNTERTQQVPDLLHDQRLAVSIAKFIHNLL